MKYNLNKSQENYVKEVNGKSRENEGLKQLGIDLKKTPKPIRRRGFGRTVKICSSTRFVVQHNTSGLVNVVVYKTQEHRGGSISESKRRR